MVQAALRPGRVVVELQVPFVVEQAVTASAQDAVVLHQQGLHLRVGHLDPWWLRYLHLQRQRGRGNLPVVRPLRRRRDQQDLAGDVLEQLPVVL